MRLRIATIAALLLLGAPVPCWTQRDTIRLGPRDTVRVPVDSLAVVLAPAAGADSIFDSPGTHELVTRVIRSGSTVPAGLDDYQAEVNSAIYLTLRADTALAAELPVTIDEVAGELRWRRGGDVQQIIQGHRVRMLAPTPYTIGSMLEAPWVIPHLYGNTIDVFSLAPTPQHRTRLAQAIHPFSLRGIDFYRYETGDTVRVRTAEGTTTLVPVTVTPQPNALAQAEERRLVAGTFWVDLDRAAVARARFGFVERSGAFLLATETGVFFELESGLVEDRYWLPYRQRREIQIASPLLGGAATIRLMTTLSGVQLNTGWQPDSAGSRLVWRLESGAFADWRGAGDDESTDLGDFADLRDAVRPPRSTRGLQASLRYERGEHLFRYNRVEGAFVGVGMRIQPRDPARRDWHLYTHAGWAFAEGVPRGELSLQWHPRTDPRLAGARWTATLGAYRRLRDMTAFRPPLHWELGYALGAALGGYDVRDYYDAQGVEAFVVRRSGFWSLRLGARYEAHDSVERNTTSSLFGSAGDFPELPGIELGSHGAGEATLRYARGSGAFGVAGGVVAQVALDQGWADFGNTRATGLLSLRFPGRYLSLIARGDAGLVTGAAPPQFLFRFGGVEGLRGYARNEFGGTTALLGRARVLLHLPPYGNEPLFRAGFFLFPPLRPAIVVSGDAGWSEVNDESAAALLRLGARATDGTRSSYGVGLSLFEDAVSVEHVWPGEGGEGKWYVGFVAYF